MTVYVVQDHRRYNKDTGSFESVYDLSPAEAFGELKYLLTPTAAPWNADSIVQDLWDGLEGWKEGDYLLMIGNPILCGLATTVACDIGQGSIRFLQWNGKEKRYIDVEAQVYQLDEPAQAV